MTTRLYVATNYHGVEDTGEGHVAWQLPDSEGKTEVTTPGHPVSLRQPSALLDAFDERILQVEPSGVPLKDENGIVSVEAAHVVATTPWDAATAAEFAINCAEHVLGNCGDVVLPDGSTLQQVIAEARATLRTKTDEHVSHLSYLHRIAGLHRLKTERSELGNLLTTVLTDDEERHVEALDDPSYEVLQPLIDAVIAAIEAVRFHAEGAAKEDSKEHQLDDRATPLPTPSVEVTGWGPIEIGGFRLPRYGPAWANAREAARHARAFAETNGGAAAESGEREWQAVQLGEILVGATDD